MRDGQGWLVKFRAQLGHHGRSSSPCPCPKQAPKQANKGRGCCWLLPTPPRSRPTTNTHLPTHTHTHKGRDVILSTWWVVMPLQVTPTRRRRSQHSRRLLCLSTSQHHPSRTPAGHGQAKARACLPTYLPSSLPCVARPGPPSRPGEHGRRPPARSFSLTQEEPS